MMFSIILVFIVFDARLCFQLSPLKHFSAVHVPDVVWAIPLV